MASQPPSIVQALDKVDQIVFRLQELQSTICVARQALSSASLNAQPNARFQAPEPVPAQSTGEWKEWSAPAQIVHQAISEILVATKYAKQLATGEESTEGEEGFSGRHPDEAAEAVEMGVPSTLPSEPSVVKRLAGDASVVVRRSAEEQEGLRKAGRSKQATVDAAATTVKNPLKVTKVKQYQKSWKLKSKDAIMFPNQAYSPSTPQTGSKNFRMLTPFKAKKYKVESSPSSKAPLLGQKREASPVKSLPLLIDRLPSKRKPAAPSKRSSPSKAEQQLPYPPSHFSRSTSSSSRKSKAPPFKVLESNSLAGKKSARPEAEPQRQSRKQKYLRESTEGRARSISPRKKQSDKENLLRSSLRRSSSAGSIPIAKSQTSSGHSILHRAKGWMLGLHSRHPQSRPGY